MSNPVALGSEQVAQLLRPINPSRVAVLDGMSHLEAYDVRAHLNRIFGFGNWSGDVLDMTLLYEQETQTRAGKPAYKVGYRCTYRLTVAVLGQPLATYTEAAVGEAIMPDFKRGDCHDMAVKTAESQALKRCATNLGDQFGLSLYRHGSTGPLVGRTLVGMPESEAAESKQAVDHDAPPVLPEQTQPEPDVEAHNAHQEAARPPAESEQSPEDFVAAFVEHLQAGPEERTVRAIAQFFAKAKAAAAKHKINDVAVTDLAGVVMTVKQLIEQEETRCEVAA